MYDQKARFGEVRKAVDKGIGVIKKVFTDKAIRQRHPTIEPDEFLDNLEAVADAFKEQLSPLEEDQPEFTDADEIGEKIIELVGDNVTPNPGYTQEDLDALSEDGEERYEAKIGPGFKDKSDKDEDTFRHDGLIYKNEFGDLIIWKQILKHANENNHKYVIFLTDDQKPDWWHEEGGRTIGPRIDLRQEISREAGVELFHMYTPGSFAYNADEFTSVKFEDETIRQIDEVSDYERALRKSTQDLEFAKWFAKNSRRNIMTPDQYTRVLSTDKTKLVVEFLEQEFPGMKVGPTSASKFTVIPPDSSRYIFVQYIVAEDSEDILKIIQHCRYLAAKVNTTTSLRLEMWTGPPSIVA